MALALPRVGASLVEPNAHDDARVVARHGADAGDEGPVGRVVEEVLLDVRGVEGAERQAARAYVVRDGDDGLLAAEVSAARDVAIRVVEAVHALVAFLR